jgi:flagellum-specific ATP synthase
VDAARAALDGHIVLSRELAGRGCYPAVDILASVSRLMNNVISDEHRALATQLRTHLADYEEAKDLVHVGAYVSGSNESFDQALARIDHIRKFLMQSDHESVCLEDTLEQMRSVLS